MNLTKGNALLSWVKLSYSPPEEYLLQPMMESWLKIKGPHLRPIGTPLTYSAFKAGDPIGDRWVVLGDVGRGRHCVVYLALDKEDKELVALKTIRNDIHVKDEAQQRFYDEAVSWVKIGQHPYILQAKKVGNSAGQIYVSMEYISPRRGKEGSSLREWLKNGNPLSIEQIVKWSIQFCYGMIHANQHGIRCHLDIKPENIFIDDSEMIKIADFGLANGISGIGTWPYMPPEQFDTGVEPNIFNDIYSFGIVLFEMTTGHLPFNPDPILYAKGNINLGYALRIAWQETHRSCRVPDAGKPFGKIIKKCLEKDREKRFRDFEGLLKALLRISRKFNIKVDKPVIQSPTPASLCAKGEQFLALGLFNEAMHLFHRVLHDNPNNPLALNGRGLSLFFLSHYEEALNQFEKVLSNYPDNVPGLIGKGLCLRSLKRSDEANTSFDKALKNQPRLPVILNQLAENWLDLGFSEKARDYYCQTIQLLIGLKRKEEALEVARQGLNHFPFNPRLLQLNAWVHRIRGGEIEKEMDLIRSLQILDGLNKKERQDAEALGIRAGTYKRLWKKNPEKYRDCLQKAFDLYYQAWEDSGHTNTYVGINAAALSLLLGRVEDSRNIALEITKSYQQRELTSLIDTATPFSSYWDQATLAEAELLLGRLGKARRLYLGIMNLYNEKLSYIESSKDQMDLIFPKMGLSIDADKFLKSSLRVPRARRICFGITGHRNLPFSKILEEKLKTIRQIKQNLLELEQLQLEVISPLAEGADRLAVKVILEEPDAILRVVLPLRLNDYLQDFSDNKSEEEFKNYLNQAEEIVYLPPVENRSEAYRNAGHYVADNCDILIALWDGKEGKGVGGTAEIVAYAKEKGVPLMWVNAKSPFKITFENLEKLKNETFIKGDFSMYKPKPIDTSHVQLPDDLLELTELLAENNHDHWSILRFKEGWKWGPERNDKAKTNPDLIPYSDLPDSEKEYDRRNALETLKAILALGYRIERR